MPPKAKVMKKPLTNTKASKTKTLRKSKSSQQEKKSLVGTTTRTRFRLRGELEIVEEDVQVSNNTEMLADNLNMSIDKSGNIYMPGYLELELHKNGRKDVLTVPLYAEQSMYIVRIVIGDYGNGAARKKKV